MWESAESYLQHIESDDAEQVIAQVTSDLTNRMHLNIEAFQLLCDQLEGDEVLDPETVKIAMGYVLQSQDHIANILNALSQYTPTDTNKN